MGGDVKLATFNVLNYFTTTGDSLTGCTSYTDRDGDPITVERRLRPLAARGMRRTWLGSRSRS